MRLGINVPEELVKQIDERANKMFISRSAYITMALSQKLQNDAILDNVPEMLEIMKTAVENEKAKSGLSATMVAGNGGEV